MSDSPLLSEETLARDGTRRAMLDLETRTQASMAILLARSDRISLYRKKLRRTRRSSEPSGLDPGSNSAWIAPNTSLFRGRRSLDRTPDPCHQTRARSVSPGGSYSWPRSKAIAPGGKSIALRPTPLPGPLERPPRGKGDVALASSAPNTTSPNQPNRPGLATPPTQVRALPNPAAFRVCPSRATALERASLGRGRVQSNGEGCGGGEKEWGGEEEVGEVLRGGSPDEEEEEEKEEFRDEEEEEREKSQGGPEVGGARAGLLRRRHQRRHQRLLPGKMPTHPRP